ncbi:cysteine protease ATG4B-like [Pollicipes pollicipes]|uniref:cysteine protease ATG4B-like n=1 Tax=Pollicipes pollicipes TaxID=41117 RepID=UPI0018854EEC|nr:cysteine protease ATG4B-like [Pollicipes pollicipes]XP_037070035.1 cysteine protease ATG4B-like [Pollicipes pollicipes]
MRRLRLRLARLRRRMLYEAQLVAQQACGGCDQFPETEQPVWLLGTKYAAGENRDALTADFRTRIWMTYRRGFPSIGIDGPTTDRGWGCMLRCGQMVLAEALQRLQLGRAWSWVPGTRQADYLRLMALFADRGDAPYSIHQIALTGERTAGKPVGTWFGPNTVAQALRHVAAHDTWLQPVLHVAMDSCVVRDEVRRDCRGTSGAWRRPLLLVVPLRLGLSELNPVYASGVRACFTVPHVVGIIGGTPNHALYFVGCVDDRLVYLDPHTTQPAAEVGSKRTDWEEQADRSYHCGGPCFMRLADIDPSLAVAFLCRDEAEFDSLCEHVQRILIEPEKHPLFELCEKRPSWQEVDCLAGAEAASFDFEAAAARPGDDTDDEFVVL